MKQISIQGDKIQSRSKTNGVWSEWSEIGGGGVSVIDDLITALDKTWSSFKTNEELSNKADIDDLQNGNLIPKTSLNALRLVNSTDEEDGQTMYMGRDGKGKIFDEASHQSYDVIDDRRIETEGIGTIDAAFSSGLYNNENILTIGVSPFLTFGASVDYQTIRQVKLLFRVSDVITAKTFKLNIQNHDANMQLDFVNGVVETINGTEYLTLSITDSAPYPFTTNVSMFEIVREGIDTSKIPTLNKVNALLANYTLNSQIQGDLTPDPTGLKIPNISTIITALSQRPPGGSISSGYVYLSNAASTVDATYKALSYTLDATATTITATANNNTVLVGRWLYPDAIAVTSIPNGLWTLFANRMVSNSAGTSNTISTVFVYHTDGSTTDLFSVTSDEINDTAMTDKYAELGVSIQTCLATDRLGIRVEFKTTHSANVVFSLVLGDGKAARFSTPLPARHNGLRDLNGDPNYQHVTQTEKDGFKTKEILITHLGYNGILHPNSYKNNSVAKTITGYRLSSNATDFSVTIAGNTYTKANITNVVLPADAELIVNSVDIVAGKDVGNAVLTIQ